MTEVSVDIYGYRQRCQYSECAHGSMSACSMQKFTEVSSETSSKPGMSS